nr:TRAP transporter substrate-binding protein [Szabonella alba]
MASAQTVLRLAENQPETNPVTIAMMKFAELVAEYSDNELNVQVFHSAQLGQEPETIEQAQAGIVDFARVNSVVLSNVSPSMGVFTLPYIFRDYDHKFAVLDGEIGQAALNDLGEVGLKGFPFMEAGSRHFYTVAGKPVRSIDDLKGMKIRVQPAPIALRMVELLGAVPTPMNYGEVYSALQTGVIDGAENDFVSYQTSSHYEVAPNYTLDGHLSPPAVLVMNAARFEGLSDAQKEAVTRAAQEAAIYEREIMTAAMDTAREAVVAAGAEIIEIDNAPFREAVAPIFAEFPDLVPVIEAIGQVE